ncbi:MAG: DUF4143 domain-containing protein [Clostridia bacterium]|nr:DUF4143 domain-containing protein [Clostridia bacterium]
MYYKRCIEKKIEQALKSSGAVQVVGPKFCGKTTTCMLYQKSIIRLNTEASIKAAEINPSAVLIGDYPRLIDEWQMVPDIWNQVKNDLDLNYQFGKYLLTGSNVPADKNKIYHSGAGRIATVKMRPMSLYESGESTGKYSLQSLFSNQDSFAPDLENEATLEDIAYYMVRGGWPLSILSDKSVSLDITRNYFSGLFTFENNKNEKFRNKKPEVFRMVLRSYARNISTECSAQTIIEDIKQSNEKTMTAKTYEEYVEALKDIFIIEDVLAWNPNIRSKTSIRSTPTRHFVDTSIALRALNISPNDLLNDFNSFGLFFEDFVVRDLSIYAEALGGEIRHYRDNAGLECDAVMHLDNGQWAAIEIKLGGEDLIESGAKSLNLLEKKIAAKSNERLPSFKMIITACGPSYRRDDGIYVVAINRIRP